MDGAQEMDGGRLQQWEDGWQQQWEDGWQQQRKDVAEEKSRMRCVEWTGEAIVLDRAATALVKKAHWWLDDAHAHGLQCVELPRIRGRVW